MKSLRQYSVRDIRENTDIEPDVVFLHAIEINVTWLEIVNAFGGFGKICPLSDMTCRKVVAVYDVWQWKKEGGEVCRRVISASTH